MAILKSICFIFFQCLNVPGHPCGAHNCPGTIRCPYVPRQLTGANICLGTYLKSMSKSLWCPHNWASLRCPNVLGHLSGVLMCPGTLPLPICARATLELTFRFPFLLVHQSRTHIRCSYVLGQNSGAHICTSLISIPMCAPAPFQCLYLSGHHFGAHICLRVHICAQHLSVSYM